MVHIESFVFFDIETTGFPWQERNRTKITELAFVAVSRMDLQRYSKIPPVSSKLTLLFNPEKYIRPDVVDLTGLSNDVLRYCPTFIEKSKSIISFLDELPKPACLVAHNGNNFDYKILLAECVDANVSLPIGILCVDSLPGFRQLFKDTTRIQRIKNQFKLNAELDQFLTDDEMSDDDFDTKNLRGSLITSKDGKDIQKIIINDSVVLLVDMNSFASEYEYDEKINQEYARKLNKKSMRNITMEDFTSDPELEQQYKKDHVKKVGSKTKSTSPEAKDTNKKGEFTLKGLYKTLLNKEPQNNHKAENDCLMLLECVMVLKDEFLPWADKSCKKLSDIKPFVRY